MSEVLKIPIIWNEANINWNEVNLLWNEVEPICADIWDLIDFTWGNYELKWSEECPSGETYPVNIAVPDMYTNAYNTVTSKLDEKSKKKLIKLVMYLKGEKYVDEKEIDSDKYQITFNDVRLLMNLKEKKDGMKLQVENVKVTIN